MVLFVLLLYVPVNSNGHYMRISSPNQTLSWASLNKWLTSTLCTLWLVTTTFLNDSFSGREENGRRSISTKVWDQVGITLATPGRVYGFVFFMSMST